MNGVFSSVRLWTLLRYDAAKGIPRYIRALLVFSGIIAGLWLLLLASGGIIGVYDRERLIEAVWALSVIFSPYIVYRDACGSNAGSISPAIQGTAFEKLLSMILICLVAVPVLAYTLLTATDMLLCLFSNLGAGPFADVLLINPFADSVGSYTKYASGQKVECGTLSAGVLVNMSLPVLYTMMLNVLFRKNKVLNTLVLTFSLLIACVAFMAVIVNNAPEIFGVVADFVQKYGSCFENVDSDAVSSVAVKVFGNLNVLFALLFLAVTYLRIKRVDN